MKRCIQRDCVQPPCPMHFKYDYLERHSKQQAAYAGSGVQLASRIGDQLRPAKSVVFYTVDARGVKAILHSISPRSHGFTFFSSSARMTTFACHDRIIWSCSFAKNMYKK